MKKNITKGKRTYTQTYRLRVNEKDKGYEDVTRYLILEKCYPRYALFSVPTLRGKFYECYFYDVVREMMSEAP